jgi:hypothetical protein
MVAGRTHDGHPFWWLSAHNLVCGQAAAAYRQQGQIVAFGRGVGVAMVQQAAPSRLVWRIWSIRLRLWMRVNCWWLAGTAEISANLIENMVLLQKRP